MRACVCECERVCVCMRACVRACVCVCVAATDRVEVREGVWSISGPEGVVVHSVQFWRRSTAALEFRDGACFEVSLFYPPFSHSSPSLTGLLAYVDVEAATNSWSQCQCAGLITDDNR